MHIGWLFAALAALTLVSSACGVAQRVGLTPEVSEETFFVEPGIARARILGIPAHRDVVVSWDVINRNPTAVGAPDGSPGDVDIRLESPGLYREKGRSVKGSFSFTTGERGGEYAIWFSNGFSLVTSKEVHLRWEIRR